MKKILIITEQPNVAASRLNHDDLFKLEKNPFCQFFGRVLFRDEIRFRKYFNSTHIQWMHSKGSSCHGGKNSDGPTAIKKYIDENAKSLGLIVAFGIHAHRLFLSISNSKLKYTINRQEKDVFLSDLDPTYKNVNIPVYLLPHVSGQAQKYWMMYAEELSDIVKRLQGAINERQ